jgi:hypothetical protein
MACRTRRVGQDNALFETGRETEYRLRRRRRRRWARFGQIGDGDREAIGRDGGPEGLANPGVVRPAAPRQVEDKEGAAVGDVEPAFEQAYELLTEDLELVAVAGPIFQGLTR